jgi:hypothetical protein
MFLFSELKLLSTELKLFFSELMLLSTEFFPVKALFPQLL